MKTLVATIAIAALLPAAATAALEGDDEAIAMAEGIIESIGGAVVWSEVRSLYIVEKSRSLAGDGIVGTFHRDLQVPRERYTLDSRTGNVIEFWWDENGVNQLINGKPNNSNLPDNIEELVVEYWPGEIYVMFHRLARQDPRLRLAVNDDNSFTAFEGEAERGRFWVNRQGELYRWRHADGTEYIYGPLKQFGDIRFPDWGTQVDGSWSFYYVEVRTSAEPPPVDFEPIEARQ